MGPTTVLRISYYRAYNIASISLTGVICNCHAHGYDSFKAKKKKKKKKKRKKRINEIGPVVFLLIIQHKQAWGCGKNVFLILMNLFNYIEYSLTCIVVYMKPQKCGWTSFSNIPIRSQVTGKNEKADSLHVPTIKFIRKKQLV